MENGQLDIATLDYDALKAAREQINDRLRELERDAVKTLEQQAIRFGFQLIKNGLGLKPRPPKPSYVNPDNPAETYSGRGRKPAWLQAKLDEGRDIEEFKAA